MVAPKTTAQKYQVNDSNVFLLQYPQMVWKKLPSIDLLNRNFHGTHIFGNLVYVLGGWRFEDNIATELYPLSEIVRLVISEEREVFQVDKINLTENLGIELQLPWITGFSVCGSEEKILVYSGNIIKGYRKDKKNL